MAYFYLYWDASILKRGVKAPTDLHQQPIDGKAPTPHELRFTTGTVILEDIAGSTMTQIRAAVMHDGWVALPIRPCLGAYRWRLHVGGKEPLPFEGGITDTQDQLGLWRIQGGEQITGPRLQPWNKALPLEWVALDDHAWLSALTIESVSPQGYFDQAVLSSEIGASGLLVQRGRVVGWTFDAAGNRAYLWHGLAGQDLAPEVGIDEFYRSTFAGGREEAFVKGLAIEESAPLKRLEALVTGFRYDPRLSEQDTPPHLSGESILNLVRSLLADLMKNGDYHAIADAFDSDVLLGAADIQLLLDVVTANMLSYGHEEALDLFEYVRHYLPPLDQQRAELMDRFHVRLYSHWLSVLIDNHQLDQAEEAHQFAASTFPDDPGIYLLGVKLELAHDNWQQAQSLLYAKEYPSDYRDEIKRLEKQISNSKARSEKIIIRFPPGANTIGVMAVLNERIQQQFIVDTGASLATVPSSAIEALGIKIGSENPIRRIYTAGGFRQAPEVELASVALGDWVVYDVKALVLDLPNQPTLGLLGLNFLNRFDIDINTEEGMLTLKPR